MQCGGKRNTAKSKRKCHTRKLLFLNVTLSELILNISRNFLRQIHGSHRWAGISVCDTELALSRHELDQFLGAATLMSCCRLRRSRLYWLAESRADTVADTMSRDHWEKIKSNLHLTTMTTPSYVALNRSALLMRRCHSWVALNISLYWATCWLKCRLSRIRDVPKSIH